MILLKSPVYSEVQKLISSHTTDLSLTTCNILYDAHDTECNLATYLSTIEDGELFIRQVFIYIFFINGFVGPMLWLETLSKDARQGDRT